MADKVLIDRAVVQQALEALEWIDPSGLTGRGGIEARNKAITALRAALAEPVRESGRVISVDQLSKMAESVDGMDRTAPGYHWRRGWNDALRRAMDYAAPQQAEPAQGPFALPCPTPKACREHCCSGHCIPRATSPQQAEPVQEPVAEVFVRRDGVAFAFWLHVPPPAGTKLFTTPPQRTIAPAQQAEPVQRKPLTEEEIAELARQEQFLLVCDGLDELTEIARAVERAHGIKEEK